MLMLLLICSLIIPVQSLASENAEKAVIAADHVLIEKSKRNLILFNNGIIIRKYKIALGRNTVGPKLRQGDGRTPEGSYIIDSRKSDSRFHLALHISYPNSIDAHLTSIAGTDPGGGIFIHGTGKKYAWMGKYHILKDWTEGCIAVTDKEIEEIWDLVPDGTPVDIVP